MNTVIKPFKFNKAGMVTEYQVGDSVPVEIEGHFFVAPHIKIIAPVVAEIAVSAPSLEAPVITSPEPVADETKAVKK